MKTEKATAVLDELLNLAERITARADQVLNGGNPDMAAGLLWASRQIYDRVTEIRSGVNLDE